MLNNSNNIKPDLNSDNLAWLSEMGISYGLLKTYQPQINKNTVADTESYKQKNLDNRENFSVKQVLNQSVIQNSSNANESENITKPNIEIISVDNLQALQQLADKCDKCVLHKQRDQMVFGFGHEQNPDLMIIGEAPGRADDACG